MPRAIVFNNIKILLDNKEYFQYNSITCSHIVNEGIALKSAFINASITYQNYISFAIDMADKQVMLGSIEIDGKIFLQGFVNLKMISTEVDNTNLRISFAINDRFFPLTVSEVIKIVFFRSHGTLQLLFAGILKELGYGDYTNYPKKINTVKDFIKNGLGVKDIRLTQNIVEYGKQAETIHLINEGCNIYKVLLNSNGYDTLFVEKYNSYLEPIYQINLLFDKKNLHPSFSNISSARKIGNDSNDASKIIILNPQINRKKPKIADKHTSLIVDYEKGMPNIQTIKSINRQVSYGGLKDAVNQSLIGLNASANSYTYQISDSIFDVNGDFFQPNRYVFVKDELHLINDKMTIVGVAFSIDAVNGINTTFNLSFAESFYDNVNAKHKKNILK
jgi:hypothetical protein